MSEDWLGYVDGANVYLYAVGNPQAFTDPSGLFIRRGLNWFSDKLSGGGASTAELQAQRDKNCADLKAQFEAGQMCQERFEKLWSSFDCGENIALTIIGGGAKGFGEGVVEAITDPHVILDAIGMIPVLGEPADLLNALLYLLEGDNVSAGLSAASAVPVFGYIASGGKAVVRAGDVVYPSQSSLIHRPSCGW
jgi:hypothetical protein